MKAKTSSFLYRFSALLSALLLCEAASSQTGPQYQGLQSEAMGHTGTVSTPGYSALFLNPAGLAGDTLSKGGGLIGTFGLNSVLLDYAAWAADNYRHLSNMDSMLTRIEEVDNKWAPFNQYLAVHGKYKAYSFAAVEDIRYNLTVGKAVITPVPGVGALADLTLTVGRGWVANNGYSLGLAVKYLHRIRFDDRLVGTTDEEFYKVKREWEKPANGIWQKLAKLKVADEIAEIEDGVGLNLGLQKTLNGRWTAGLALLDFPTVLNSRFIPPDINIGTRYVREFEYELKYRSVSNIDLHHFLIPGNPWFKQLRMGTALEAYMRGRQVSYLALGLNDGYPTFGVRFGYFAYFTYTYFAEELGTQPGQHKLSFHKLTIDLDI